MNYLFNIQIIKYNLFLPTFIMTHPPVPFLQLKYTGFSQSFRNSSMYNTWYVTDVSLENKIFLMKVILWYKKNSSSTFK